MAPQFGQVPSIGMSNLLSTFSADALQHYKPCGPTGHSQFAPAWTIHPTASVQFRAPGRSDWNDYGLVPEVPPQSGLNLYAHSKSLGQEVCRLFTEHHDIWVQEYLFYNFREVTELKPGAGGVPFIVSWGDAGEMFRLGLDVDLAKLPSKCEVFFVLGDMPHGKFLNDKAKRILGFAPKDDLSALWRRPG